MALRVRRMIVRPAADIGPAQNNQRTRAVKCRGAVSVIWIARATNANALSVAAIYVTQDEAFDAPGANFRDVAAAGDAVVLGGTAIAAQVLNTGGRILTMQHESGARMPIPCEQAELRFNSHATLTINGLEIEALVIDEVGLDSNDSGLVNAT